MFGGVHYYLPAAAEGRGQEVIKCFLSVCSCVCASVHYVFA